jgi:hypothetical protein
MSRVPNWTKHFIEAVETATRTPFEYGKHDCCLMAADIVKAIAGYDPAEGLRGTYSDEAGAAQAVAAHGGLVQLVEARAAMYSWKSVPVRTARRGDFIVYRSPLTKHLSAGICTGSEAIFPSIENNVIAVPLSKCLRAWRIE